MIELCDEDRRRLDLLVGIDGMTREDVTALAEIAFVRLGLAEWLPEAKEVCKTPNDWRDLVAWTCGVGYVGNAVADSLHEEMRWMAKRR